MYFCRTSYYTHTSIALRDVRLPEIYNFVGHTCWPEISTLYWPNLRDLAITGKLIDYRHPNFVTSRAVLLLIKIMRRPSDDFWKFFNLPPSCIMNGDPVDIAIPIPVSMKLHNCGRGPMYVKSWGL